MTRWGILLALLALGAAAALVVRRSERPADEAAAGVAPVPRRPPIDAAQVASGRLAMERLPVEVGTALETFSEEIVRNAQETSTKQARIHGTCAPGSAIRVIAEDGTVRCQAFAHGVVSVAAIAALPRLSATATEAGSVPGAVGRYQSGGEDDYLVAPISLPDGASVTGLSYLFYDAAMEVDSVAFLYRSDDQPLASVSSSGAEEKVRALSTDAVRLRKVDNARYGYFIYFQLSTGAGARLMPIAASVSYRLQ